MTTPKVQGPAKYSQTSMVGELVSKAIGITIELLTGSGEQNLTLKKASDPLVKENWRSPDSRLETCLRTMDDAGGSAINAKTKVGPTNKSGGHCDLSQFSDEQLLDTKICDLVVKIADSALADRIDELCSELHSRGIRFRPRFWLSDDWYSPDGIPGVARKCVDTVRTIDITLREYYRKNVRIMELGNRIPMLRTCTSCFPMIRNIRRTQPHTSFLQNTD